MKVIHFARGTVAEWSKVLQFRENKQKPKDPKKGRMYHATVDSIRPAAPGSILNVPKMFFEFLDTAEIYRQQCIALSVDSVKNAQVDQTHLVLASTTKNSPSLPPALNRNIPLCSQPYTLLHWTV